MHNLDTMEGCSNYTEAIKDWASECVDSQRDAGIMILTDKDVQSQVDSYWEQEESHIEDELDAMEIDNAARFERFWSDVTAEDYEPLFRSVFEDAYREYQQECRGSDVDLYQSETGDVAITIDGSDTIYILPAESLTTGRFAEHAANLLNGLNPFEDATVRRHTYPTQPEHGFKLVASWQNGEFRARYRDMEHIHETVLAYAGAQALEGTPPVELAVA